MNNMTKGGLNLCYFFRVKLKSDGTVYEFLDALTDVVAGTPTIANAAFKLEGAIGSSKPQYQDTGLVNFSLDQYANGEDIDAFLKKTKKPAGSSTTNEINFEDGTKAGGTSGDVNDAVLMVSYLGGIPWDAPTKRHVISAIGSIAPTSGSFETASDSFSKPTFEFVGKSLGKDLSIPAALYNSSYVTVSAAKTITTGENYISAFETIPA